MTQNILCSIHTSIILPNIITASEFQKKYIEMIFEMTYMQQNKPWRDYFVGKLHSVFFGNIFGHSPVIKFQETVV